MTKRKEHYWNNHAGSYYVEYGQRPGPEILRFRYGLDITRDVPKRRGFDYEDFCFRQIAHQPRWSFLIGPGIVNSVLECHQVFACLVKPDYLQVQFQDDDRWILTGVVECRSGVNIDTQRKVQKLPHFIDHLRKEPHLFPAAIAQHAPQEIPITDTTTLIVPDDSDIVVTFITPEPRLVIAPDSALRVEHVVLPFAAQNHK